MLAVASSQHGSRGKSAGDLCGAPTWSLGVLDAIRSSDFSLSLTSSRDVPIQCRDRGRLDMPQPRLGRLRVRLWALVPAALRLPQPAAQPAARHVRADVRSANACVQCRASKRGLRCRHQRHGRRTGRGAVLRHGRRLPTTAKLRTARGGLRQHGLQQRLLRGARSAEPGQWRRQRPALLPQQQRVSLAPASVTQTTNASGRTKPSRKTLVQRTASAAVPAA